MDTAARVAVLDDYQDVARTLGPWDRLGDRIALTVFTEHLDDADVVDALVGFDVVVAMRERTAFARARLEGLPALRLLVTTDPRTPPSTSTPAPTWASPSRPRGSPCARPSS